MAYADPEYIGGGYTVNGSYGEPMTINYDMTTYTSGATTMPFVMMPARFDPTPGPEKVDDSPLTWLKDQVEEITELARVA